MRKSIFIGLAVSVLAGCGYVGLMLLLPTFGYHAPGGRVSTWHLRDGTRVRFFKREHANPGRDTVKVLEVTRPGGEPTEYTFAVWHTAYGWVELRANDAQSVIWLVDTGYKQVGCSLDLASGQFADERGSHPLGVGVSSGQVVSRE